MLSAVPAIFGQRCASNLQTGCVRAGAVCGPVERGLGSHGVCSNKPGLPPGERECECLGTIPPPPPLLDPRCGDRTATGKFVCTIDNPAVTRRETRYANVVFAPGDILDITADGCVQTGGRGSTWKRYVNPSGPNSESLYHGLIRIPTATHNSDLVRINSIIGKRLTVSGVGVPESELFLHLGYEDDDYSDNGYYAHDDGTDDQCKSNPSTGFDGGPAHVTITVYRGVAPGDPTSRFDFDVLGTSFDPNGLFFNPYWSWQLRPENAGKIPDTSSCHNFSVRNTTLGVPNEFEDPSFADCTDQPDANSLDFPIDFNATICNYGTVPYFGSTFAGHLNWFPVTMEGNAFWGDQGFDDDNTFTFIKAKSDNPLSVNGRNGLHVEFDSDETTDNFTSPAWKPFKDALDNGDKAAAQAAFEGHTILTGMFGLDGEHGLKAELHPLYAMATNIADPSNGPNEETWLIFVRNQGDEGFCSSQIWQSGFNDYTFRLPWPPGALSVAVDRDKTNFTGTDGTSGPVVTFVAPPAKNPAVFVSFHLGPPVSSSSIIETSASVPFVNGGLHLIWNGGTVGNKLADARLAQGVRRQVGLAGAQASAAAAGEEAGDVEDTLKAAVAPLSPSVRRKVETSRRIANSRPVVLHVLPPAEPARPIGPRAEIASSPTRHAIKGGPAVRKATKDRQQVRALCAATSNKPSGLPAQTCR